MSADRQHPDPDRADLDAIAEALDRISMRRPPRPGSDAAPGSDGHGHHHDHPRRGADHDHARPGTAGGHSRERAPRGAMGARRMLHAIVHSASPRSITDLGLAIGVDQPRASRLVQALADAALVRRIPDPADGRRVVIEPTKAGRAHIAAHAEARAGEVAIAAAALTPAERSELARLLATFAEAWPR